MVPSRQSQLLSSSSSLTGTRGPVQRALVLSTIAALLVPLTWILGTGWSGAEVTEEQLGHEGVLVSTKHHRVAPGLELSTFSRLEQAGWNNGSVLTADLTEPTLSLGVEDGGTVASRGDLADLMVHGPKGTRAVAAVNGSFFDIDRTDAPVHSVIADGQVRVGTATAQPSLTIADGRAAVKALTATGTVRIAGTDHRLGGVNLSRMPADSIGLFNEAWGTPNLDLAVGAPDKRAARAARATVVDGKVTAVSGISDVLGAPDIPAHGQVLVGREKGADTIASLKVGDRVEVTVRPSEDVETALAGSDQIVENGEVPTLRNDPLITTAHPRTAIGVSRDGSRLFAVVIDGRSASSRGMTLDQLGRLMRDLGAYSAVNMDGGGSSALIARAAGAKDAKIWNSPSDGTPRRTANALVFYSAAPAQKLADVAIAPALEQQGTVLPGFHRTVETTGLAANLAPVLADGAVQATGPVTVERSTPTRTSIRATASGSATLTFSASGHQARMPLTVIGKPVALAPSAASLNLPDARSHREVTLAGVDAQGRRSRIETADVTATATPGFTVTPDQLGSWSIRGDGSTRTGTVTLAAGEQKATIAVTFGTSTAGLLDMSDVSSFSAKTDRAKAEIAPAEGPADKDGKPKAAIGLTYDFTTSSATRGAYLVPDEPAKIEGSALALELDVRGDGSGAWPRIQVRDAQGSVMNLDGEHLDFKGWKRLRFAVPDGVPQPLTVERIRFMETRGDASYRGDVAVADLTATTTPTAPAPEEKRIEDAALLSQGSIAGRPQRIAVMSDAQFVARAPDSPTVAGARRTLKEIRAARPDLLIIDGDLVDEGSPADLAFAKKVLDEELGGQVPYLYVPGNHEVMGGKITEFQQVFGETSRVKDLGRTRIITLDSSSGSLRGGGIDQIARLQKELAAVSSNPGITGVIVAFHHPPSDPLPDKASQLGDQREARELEALLGRFRRTSGKSAAVINGHVGAFHGSVVDGVTYLINGNSGKNPAGTPQTGGFTGWTMLGVDPGAGTVGTDDTAAGRAAWLAAETRPWVDTIRLDAPASLKSGKEGRISASLTQDGRTIPVAWPVTAQWGGTGVVVDDGSDRAAADAPQDAVVRVNPRTGTITGLRTGRATVRVTVNGRTAEATVAVEAGNGPKPQAFRDVPPGTMHYDHIQWMAEQGIAKGWPDGTFRPLTPVNRDAMAAYLYRMAGSPAVKPPRTSPFRDVRPGIEHYDAIIWAHQAGITTGFPDGTFRPTQPIARDAMAAFLYRYAGSPAAPAPMRPVFSDVPARSMYAKEIAWMRTSGITTGWPDGTYRPASPVNRDAMAAFLHRMKR